jgi:DNA-binding transcriptional ArsR family regulator
MYGKQCVHGPWTVDEITILKMKSQDILLLLKLVAVERQERFLRKEVSGPSSNFDMWRDWDDEDSEVEESTDPSFADQDNKALLSAGLYSVRSLAGSTGIGKSEVSNALSRCYENGLAKLSRGGSTPLVNKRGWRNFLYTG